MIEYVQPIASIDPKTLALAAAALTAGVVIYGAGLPILARLQSAGRLRAIKNKRAQLKRKYEEESRSPSLRERYSRKSPWARVLETLKIERLMEMRALKQKLVEAGWHDPSAAPVFIVSHSIVPALIGMVLWFIFLKGELVDVSTGAAWAIVAAGSGFGALLPTLLLKNAVQKRREILEQQFPEALDLLLVCVEAGLSVEAAFLRVTDELTESHPEIAEEMKIASAELAYLTDRKEAFRNISKRVSNNSFKSLSTALVQSETYGTAVTQSLRLLSSESRQNRELEADKQGQKLGTKLTIPIVAFFVPFLILILIAPALIKIFA